MILSSIKEAQSFLFLFPSDDVRYLSLTVSSEKTIRISVVFPQLLPEGEFLNKRHTCI